MWLTGVKEEVLCQNCFKNTYKHYGVQFFLLVADVKPKRNGHKMGLGKLDIEKICLWEDHITSELEKKSPSLKVFQILLNNHCQPDLTLAAFMSWAEVLLDPGVPSTQRFCPFLFVLLVGFEGFFALVLGFWVFLGEYVWVFLFFSF